MPVKKGDTIKVEYTGTLEDGTVFDSSEEKEPLEFEAGSGQVIKGFDEAVIGMEKGEEKEVTLEPTEAYGYHDPNLIKKIDRDKLPEEPEPKPGMMLALTMQDGQQTLAKITEATDSDVTLDLNHPLAGKTLHFTIRVL